MRFTENFVLPAKAGIQKENANTGFWIKSRMTIQGLPLLFLSIVLFFLSQTSHAQFASYNHPELKWVSIETEHFVVHFYEGTERTARIIAGISELIYEPITDLYDYRPDGKVHWVIRDHDDYSNGVTYYYENKIEIWTKPLDFELRGTHHWLYDVITHEYTHMIQLGASRKAPRWMPGIYFQLIDYEKEKRPDVLYGYPNRIASFPVAMTSVPMWFAEGTAQYMTKDLRHDWWDSHRDMMLRVRVLNENLLTWNQMGVFGKSSLGSESVYNQGYSLVRYIAKTYGEQSVADLAEAQSDLMSMSFDAASKKTLGISGDDLYRNWVAFLRSGYDKYSRTILDNTVSGEIVHDEGFGNLYPAFRPDGKTIAFISNKNQDYLSLGSLYYFDIETEEVTESKSPVKGDFDYSPDGKYIVYSRKDGPNRQGSKYNDLYLWDIEEEKDIRLTHDARLITPAFSPDGKQIVAVHQADGTHNLVVVTLPDEIPDEEDIDELCTKHYLTSFNNGQQIYRPQYSSDGRKVFAATADLGPRDISAFDANSGDMSILLESVADERGVTVSPDGKHILFACDQTGIFNLYRYNLSDGSQTALTNVIGGAFMPDVAKDGKIVYAEFADGGYKIRLIQEANAVNPELMEYIPPAELERPNLISPPSIDIASTPYSSPFNKLFILPRVAWDFGTFKPGFYAYTGDLLDKVTLFTAASLGKNQERDLYISSEYRVLAPTIHLEVFNIVRAQSQTFDDNFVIVDEQIIDSMAVPIFDTYSIDYRFNLTELDLGAKMPIGDDYIASAFFRYSNYKSILEFDDGFSFNYTYHKGKAYILRLNSDQRSPKVASDIHPQGGWLGYLQIARENNRFLDGFEIEADKGTLVEVYNRHNYYRIETDIDYYYKLYKNFFLNPRLIGGWISDNSIDSFYHLYAGGLPGLRGYTFYSLGGTKSVSGRMSLRFPLLSNVDKRWGPFYLDRVHAALFAEVGDAWTSKFEPGELKRDIGAELRFKLFSWYGFPTDIQFTTAYGLDDFIVSDQSGIHEYGKTWRWYFTLLFDFI